MYVDAIHDKEKDIIHVSERVNGERKLIEYPAKYVFYYTDPKGNYRSIYGDRLRKFETTSYKTFKKELGKIESEDRKIFESDIQPLNRCLEENYLNTEIPTLHVAFFDIEVDFIPEKGFSDPQDPFAPITAITIYLDWLDRNITLALPPDSMTMEEAEQSIEDIEDVYLFGKETDLLKAFIALVDDADIITGWNSTLYDIPYVVNRIITVLSKNYARKLCLWNREPVKKTVVKYNNEFTSYDLIGRIHLDYLELYSKNTPNQLHSFRLDYVGEIEVGENKTPYDGTLDQLYNNDFRKFIEYNRQDVMLMVKIDRKNMFIDLHNNVSHTNTVTIPATLGSVNLIDQAIINEAHSYDLIMPNKDVDNTKEKSNDGEFRISDSVPGAYVIDPKTGLHDWIGSLDIQSLYPSTIRTFNMSPETLIGQLRQTNTEKYLKKKIKEDNLSARDAWGTIPTTLEFEDVYERSKNLVTIDFVDGTSIELTGEEINDLIFKHKTHWCLTANGTIFDTSFSGIIPTLLKRWYDERVEMKNSKKQYEKKYEKSCDEKDKELASFWDLRQWVRKILLNSLYGALLNKYCRVFDQRLGQSVTLSGRNITKHMAATVNELITGEYNNEGKAVLYGDTDSVYFSAYEVLKDDKEFSDFNWNNTDEIINFYNLLGNETDKTFPDFLKHTFNVPYEFANIGTQRETVGSKGLIIRKKRYAIMVVDDEGKRKDVNGKPGEIKAMGLEIKRSDTPKRIQDFLEHALELVLMGKTNDEIIKYIKEFRDEFRSWPDWEKGNPKQVNALTYYEETFNKSNDLNEFMYLNKMLINAKSEKEKEELKNKMEKFKKKGLPGHVQASINYNILREQNHDYYSMPIYDGSKIIVCKLKKNPLNMKSIAYPVDETRLPDWFKNLPFDAEQMERDQIDTKLKNIFGKLNIDLEESKNMNMFDELFS